MHIHCGDAPSPGLEAACADLIQDLIVELDILWSVVVASICTLSEVPCFPLFVFGNGGGGNTFELFV
jgi:hypothetical protein